MRVLAFFRSLVLSLVNWTVFCQIYVGGIFVYAGFQKLRAPYAFMAALVHYGIVPLRFVFVTTFLLAMVEVGLGIHMILGRYLRIVSVMLACMLVVFSGVLVRVILSGNLFSCGCLGISAEISFRQILENAVLVGMCGWVCIFSKTWVQINPKGDIK